jgi:Family of unknown function (DUF6508)
MADELVPPTPEAVAALLELLPVLESPDFLAGEWCGGEEDADGVISMPWFELSPDASAFVDALRAHGLIVPFDWVAWHEEAECIVTGDGLEHADLLTLRKLLILLVRRDRFVEGSLGEAFASGLVVRIVRRLQELNPQTA